MRVLWSLLLLVLTCTTLVSSQQCANRFTVGTEIGLSDVVSDCSPQAGWNDIDNHREYPLDTTLELVASVARTVTSQDYSIGFQYAQPYVMVEMEDQTGTLYGGIPTPLHIKFKCLDDNGIKQTLVTVTFTFLNGPTTPPVTFYFWKICQLPPLYIGSYGPAGMEANVAIGGHAVPSFQHISTPDIKSEDFFIWIPNVIGGFPYYPYWNFSVTQPVLISWANHNLLSDITYTLSSTTVVPAVNDNAYTKLTIFYSCNNTLPAGSDFVVVSIDVGFLEYLQFTYTKNCSYGDGRGNATIFNTQLVRTGELAIAGGTIQDDWGRASGHHIPQNEHEVDFTVWITGQTREGGDHLPFNVTTLVTNGANNIMINDGSIVPRPFLAGMKDSPSGNITVPMDLTCLHLGEGTGTVIFDFGQQYNPLTIHFQYLCSTPYFDIDFMSQDGSKPIQRIVSLNIPQFWNYTSPLENLNEKFLISLNRQTSYMIQDITFDNITYDSHVMNPIMTPTNQWLPLNQLQPRPAQITFNCLPDLTTISITDVIIRIDYGWNTYQQIAFKKVCGPIAPTPIPTSSPSSSSSSSSSGWSAAGIFFFTVFILTLVGCLTGAGYKYAKEDKRGWDVIPGITYYRSCYENACPTKRYTPQTDYYSDNVPDHGGKSYQTDL